ncbi:MAG: leucine-rich repeat protein [Clostridia bacterium]|nr:leucine-rich repeat protein [Clostridia bacterium]
MKKILSLILMGAMLITSIFTLASCGGPKFEFELNEDGTAYTLVGMENAIGDVVIPGTYNDLPVTKIGRSSIDDKPRMTSLVFPDSITEIDESAFSGNLNELVSITIGKNVTFIGDYAFTTPSTLKFEKINYCGTPEQWKELCRYQTSTTDGEEKEFTKIYDDDKVTVHCNYVMPSED